MAMLTREKPRRLTRFLHKLAAALEWNDQSRFGLLQDQKLVDLLEDAHREWNHAKIYFNNVTEPDLIDYAVFYLGAAEKKYTYLWKCARDAGVCIERINFGNPQ